MPRRGRVAPPRNVKRIPPSVVSTPNPSHVPAPAGPVANHPQQPSVMGHMAATATGVAVGSAVGQTLGHVVTGLMSERNSEAASAPAAPSSSSTPPVACAREMKQFLDCAYKHNDLSMCESLSESLRQCKTASMQD